MIKVPKKEMGEKVFHAGQYMLQEIAKQVVQRRLEGEIPESIVNDLNKIDNAKTSEEIKELIKTKYKVLQKLEIDLDDKIGSTKNHISRAYRGRKGFSPHN